MIRSFYRLPNVVQFLAILSCIVVLGAALFDRLQTTVIHNQALHRAKDTANLVEALGDLSAGYNGFWVFKDPNKPLPVGDFLDVKILNEPKPLLAEQPGLSSQEGLARRVALRYGGMDLPEAIEAGHASQLAAFMRKNPALVQRELSDVVEKSPMRVKFRLTSDRFFNPKNAPNPFEQSALASLRASTEKASDYWEIKDGALLYARRLTAKAGCMSCHDTAERAPEVIKAKYANSNGFGYVEGGVAGVISVTVPIERQGATEMARTMDPMSWTLLAVLCAFILMSIAWFVSLTASAKAMSRYMAQILHSKPGEKIQRFTLDKDEATSRNELHRVSLGIKALHRALRLAQKSRASTGTGADQPKTM